MANQFRCTGRTYRMLLKAILHASENDNTNVNVIAFNHAQAHALKESAHTMASGFCDVDEKKVLKLHNGSIVHFHAPDDSRLVKSYKTFVDHSVK